MDFVKWISQLLFLLVQGIFMILYYIEVAFYWLAGAGNPLDVKLNDGQADAWMDSNIIVETLSKDGIQTAFTIFILIALGIFAVAIIIGTVKAHLMSDDPGAGKKIVKRSLESILYFIFLSVGFIFFMTAVSSLMSVVTTSISDVLGTGSGQTSMANTLFYSCFSGVDEGEFGKNIQLITPSGGTMSYDQINAHVNLKFTEGNFNYIMAILVGCVILWAMFVCVLGLVERIINIILLYLIGPATVGTVPMDDGERFKAWRSLVLSKALGVFGNILSIYIYLFVISTYNNFIAPNSHMALKVIYYVIAIGGAFTASKGSNLIASIISREAGAQDGWSQSQTNGLLQGGTSLAKGVLGGATVGIGAMVSGGAGALQGGSGAFTSSQGRGGVANSGKKSLAGAFQGIKNDASKVGHAIGTGFSYGRFQGAMSGAIQGAVGGAVALGGVALGGFAKGVGALGHGINVLAHGGKAGYQQHLDKKQAKKDIAKKFTQERLNANEEERKNKIAFINAPLENLKQNKLERNIQLANANQKLKTLKTDRKMALNDPKAKESFKKKYGFEADDEKANKKFVDQQKFNKNVAKGVLRRRNERDKQAITTTGVQRFGQRTGANIKNWASNIGDRASQLSPFGRQHKEIKKMQQDELKGDDK